MTHCCLREHKTQVFPNEYKRKAIQLFVRLIMHNEKEGAIKSTQRNWSQNVQKTAKLFAASLSRRVNEGSS